MNYRQAMVGAALLAWLAVFGWSDVAPRAAGAEASRRGTTLYVSKLGDNSDGSSWAKAFHTIQAALSAVPDAGGGHRVLIRPDRYVEADLAPAHAGAVGAYNVIEGDVDGALGSGAKGAVIIDSGDPQRGFKSLDWWGPWKCNPTFSGACWDRWTFRRLYCSGSEGGIGWDMTCRDGTEFSAVVEDCVAIGRFAGGCVMGHVGRREEPVVFRRCSLVCLDWWGDAGAAYVRASHKRMPDWPDAVFEDCTLISPDNALEVGYPGYQGYTRVKFTRSNLIVWNFSQPQGTPSGGIIHTPLAGSQLHVDLEDCTMMGCKVFGCGSGRIGYSVRGKVQAYVQFQQAVPEGFQQLARWPVEMFHPQSPPGPPPAALVQPAAAAKEPAGGQGGVTLYVSKQGDNSDGRSWAKAFHTIQAALAAVPDGRGGHRIVVRPDTYVEANLFPAHKGAAGAYNLLVGDCDGSLGSGATGRVIIDSGDPLGGFKSYDWWSTIRAYKKGWSPQHTGETFAANRWDRWIIRRVYATGSDAGLFFDLVSQVEPFTVIVEDSVGIGRAFGGGVGHVLSRPGEPTVFRRCTLCCLDRWGDAGGAYVRAEHPEPPKHPDVVFDNCTLIGPDNALQGGNPGYEGYTRVKLANSRLIVLNFSQPRGTPSTGVIESRIDGKLLAVDLENCTLMGYKVFGAGKGEVPYTTRGKVRAYVEYEQPVPAGIERLTRWPVEVFAPLLPEKPGASPQPESAVARRLTKLPGGFGRDVMESTPLVFKGRQLLFHSRRPGGHKADLDGTYLFIKDPETGKELPRFGRAHSLGSALVDGDRVHVFAAELTENDWFHDIYHFTSTDLKDWKRELAIPRAGGEHLLNSSVCRDGQGWLMAYESNQPVAFCFKFARSEDLRRWKKTDGLVFAGVGGAQYSACPVIRYFEPYYYVIYLHAAIPGHNGWVSFLARSKDLATWQLSPRNPILEAGKEEGLNNSDVDLIEIDGKTYVYYCTGDQQTWGELRRAVYPGPMAQFFQSYFPEGEKMVEVSARRPAAPRGKPVGVPES